MEKTGRNYQNQLLQNSGNKVLQGSKERSFGLKLNIRKTKIMAPGPITLWQIDGETMETVRDHIPGLQNQCRW